MTKKDAIDTAMILAFWAFCIAVLGALSGMF